MLNRRRTPPQTVEASSFEDELGLVALGRAMNITVGAAGRLYPRTGISYVPISDIGPCTVAVTWSPARVPPLLASFLEAADDVIAAAKRGVPCMKSRSPSVGWPGGVT